jgi:hypothetical protein
MGLAGLQISVSSGIRISSIICRLRLLSSIYRWSFTLGEGASAGREALPCSSDAEVRNGGDVNPRHLYAWIAGCLSKGSSGGWGTGYAEWRSLWIYTVPPEKYWGSTSYRSLPLPSQSLTFHPSALILPFDASREILTASVNKQQSRTNLSPSCGTFYNFFLLNEIYFRWSLVHIVTINWK